MVALWFLSHQVMSVEVTLNDRTLSIPPAPGFTEISQQFEQARQLGESLTPDMNRLLSVYLSHEDVERLQAEEPATWRRYMLVQVERQMQNIALNRSGFEQIKQILESQQQLLLDQVGTDVEQSLNNLKAGNEQAIDLPVGTSVPLGTFADSNSHVSMSTLIHYAGETADLNYYVVAGTNVVYVADKLLFVYVYSTYETQADLDWVESTSKDWIATISELNPATGSLLNRIDWRRVLRHALIGAIVAGFAAALVVFVRRRNRET